jgi:hypothetical protein
MEYRVIGEDVRLDEKVILHEAWTQEEAVSWAKRYTSKENMGGWQCVYVCTLYQTDVDWDGEPVLAEHILWSCYSEPMDWSDNAMEEF